MRRRKEYACWNSTTDTEHQGNAGNWLKLLKQPVEEGDNEHLKNLRNQLNEYFDGSLKAFTVPLVTPGTDFQQTVWKELLEIPFGKTRSYQEQADILNKPDSVRAVANANGMNRISIVIPCHRVIGSDGRLTGYGGGLKRKKWLLDHEKNIPEKRLICHFSEKFE